MVILPNKIASATAIPTWKLSKIIKKSTGLPAREARGYAEEILNALGPQNITYDSNLDSKLRGVLNKLEDNNIVKSTSYTEQDHDEVDRSWLEWELLTDNIEGLVKPALKVVAQAYNQESVAKVAYKKKDTISDAEAFYNSIF